MTVGREALYPLQVCHHSQNELFGVCGKRFLSESGFVRTDTRRTEEFLAALMKFIP